MSLEQIIDVQGSSACSVKSEVAAQPFKLRAPDGFTIGGFVWRDQITDGSARPVVIINPATSVLCRYYFRFATFLFRHGFDVITYDYRGIGESRPRRLRGFEASWADWGRLDFEAVLQHADTSFPGQPIDVVAHSAGGMVLGLAPSNPLIRRVFTVGAQCAFWRDYAPDKRLRMLAKWHLFMPLLTALFGYFPGKRIGWIEDTPKDIVRDWVSSPERLRDSWRKGSRTHSDDSFVLEQQFAAITAPILAFSVTDDEFATVPAIDRLLANFVNCSRMHLRITPDSIDEPRIGHFGFFHSRFEEKLWSIPLQWLKFGQFPEVHAEIWPKSSEAAKVATP